MAVSVRYRTEEKIIIIFSYVSCRTELSNSAVPNFSENVAYINSLCPVLVRMMAIDLGGTKVYVPASGLIIGWMLSLTVLDGHGVANGHGND